MKAYKVLVPRLVLPRNMGTAQAGGNRTLARGDQFTAVPCAFLRRAERDGDIAEHIDSDSKPQGKSKKEGK